MTLGMAQQKIDSDPETAKALIAEAHTVDEGGDHRAAPARPGHPRLGARRPRAGRGPLPALAGRSPVPVVLDVRLDGRCSRDAEAAVYFAIAESLTNAAKHSQASECVVVRVRDGGTCGGPRRGQWDRRGDGGPRRRARRHRQPGARGQRRSAWTAPAGGPTSLEVSIPCTS